MVFGIGLGYKGFDASSSPFVHPTKQKERESQQIGAVDNVIGEEGIGVDLRRSPISIRSPSSSLCPIEEEKGNESKRVVRWWLLSTAVVARELLRRLPHRFFISGPKNEGGRVWVSPATNRSSDQSPASPRAPFSSPTAELNGKTAATVVLDDGGRQRRRRRAPWPAASQGKKENSMGVWDLFFSSKQKELSWNERGQQPPVLVSKRRNGDR
ncbi:unnamed protein product [Lactuca virosa]|uniref:Uncharacterized protein n=1 Tax=Lactuca virosa TaxID=75947 RepID=A0AAU9PU78_9ASTR|nr:unnamed protein product [Lactuca virosa]